MTHRKVGRRRRGRMEDVMACKARTDRDRQEALDGLALPGQGLDRGYPHPWAGL